MEWRELNAKKLHLKMSLGTCIQNNDNSTIKNYSTQ